MAEITKAEFKRLLLRKLLVWPPFNFDGKTYAWKVECEDTPAEFVWCTP